MANKMSSIRLASWLFALVILAACSDGSNNSRAATPSYNFDEVDARLQQFLDESDVFDGISVILVDTEQGAVHEAAFGDHTLDTVVMLASTSKMPSVSLLMALHDDASLNFDVEETIDRYLLWDGVYGDRTTVSLVSNTSGIPGLAGLAAYGPHMCQFTANVTLNECAEILYTVEVPGSVPPGTRFSYGGTQWQLAGAVAEHVTNSTWGQAFDRYLAGPCDLEVFEYGNMWTVMSAWTGSPDSLLGQANAHIEGGAITNLQDYAKILLMHLRGGRCGDTQVMSTESVAFMQENRAAAVGVNYGMGWWVLPGDGMRSTIVYDPGAFGAVSWLDMERGIGGYIAIDDYTRADPGAVYALALDQIIPLQQQAVDAARAAAGN
jgi:CubicO group peptidase (beta-lactamase class C family)